MNLRFFIVGLILLATVVGSWFYLQRKIITVTLLDMDSRVPIQQAMVSTDFDVTDTIKRHGGFDVRIQVNPLTEYSTINLRVIAPGYRPGSLSVAIPRWQARPTIEILLEPTLITGQVVDALTEEPLLGVHIGSGLGERQLITITNELGQFTLPHLWIDDPVFVKPLLGYLPHDPYELKQPDLSLPLRFALHPTVVTGTVTTAAGEPLANIILSAGHGLRRQTVTSNEGGQFTFYRLVADDLIEVKSPEYLPAEQFVGAGNDLSLAIQPYELTLAVWDDYLDQPMSQATIRLTNGMTATTDNLGQATLSTIPVTTTLSVSKLGYYTTTIAYHGEAKLAVEMVPGGLQGRVRDKISGEPLPYALVYVGQTVTQADEEGRFSLTESIHQPTPVIVKTAGYQLGHAILNRRGVVEPEDGERFNNLHEQWLTPTPCANPPPGPPCLELSLKRFTAKAIYVPFHYFSSREVMESFLTLVERSPGLNALVVDVKGDFGRIAWDSEVPLAQTLEATANLGETGLSLTEFVSEAKERGIYTIARFVVFKDDVLANGKPSLAVVDGEGEVWIDREDLAWVNPFREEVWQYNLELAKEVAEFGFHEINFDYIRFPSDGDVLAIRYEEEDTLETRTASIGEFMARMRQTLQPYPIFISADVFGLTVWVPPENDMNIGQRVIDLTPHIDYLSPMVYPSTFATGSLGYADPSEAPYEVVFYSQQEAMGRVPPQVKVRPWLQAYWYDVAEMGQLRQAAVDAEASGWMWWNAAGVYADALFATEK